VRRGDAQKGRAGTLLSSYANSANHAIQLYPSGLSLLAGRGVAWSRPSADKRERRPGRREISAAL